MTEKAKAVNASALQAALDLRVMVSRLRRRILEVSEGGDLMPAQASVLMRIGKNEANSASALAIAEGVRPQSMAVTLATLERLGLIARLADPADGRRQLIALTEAGQARVAGALQAGREWLVLALDERYSEAERQLILQAAALLERLLH